jgi:transcription antitermination factor NusG
MEWLACRVTTGQEYLIRGKIKAIAPDAEVLIPRKYFKELKQGVVKTKSERMLPGYLLIGSQSDIGKALEKGFIKVVGKVTEEEVALLRAQEGLKEDDLGVGIKVLVLDGPFQGCKGTIEKDSGTGVMDCKLLFHSMEVNASVKSELLSSIK